MVRAGFVMCPCCCLQRMVRDLDFAVEVVGMPIVREADGLAMSRWDQSPVVGVSQEGVCCLSTGPEGLREGQHLRCLLLDVGTHTVRC